MIIDKHKQTEQAQIPEPVVEVDVQVNDDQYTTDEELYAGNPMSDVYRAIEAIIKDIRIDPDDPESPPLFKTVKLNTGQLNRIKNNKHNEEYALGFPAVFIHMINVRWLVATNRIGEGRADLRIQYVLNRLNNSDDEYQTEGFEVFQRINTAINENKVKFPALTERVQLTYWDQVESFDDGLQQYWITYEVWFKDFSSFRYRKYVDAHVVMPPFTNHSDQNDEANYNHHDNHQDPTIEEAAGFQVP